MKDLRCQQRSRRNSNLHRFRSTLRILKVSEKSYFAQFFTRVLVTHGNHHFRKRTTAPEHGLLRDLRRQNTSLGSEEPAVEVDQQLCIFTSGLWPLYRLIRALPPKNDHTTEKTDQVYPLALAQLARSLQVVYGLFAGAWIKRLFIFAKQNTFCPRIWTLSLRFSCGDKKNTLTQLFEIAHWQAS